MVREVGGTLAEFLARKALLVNAMAGKAAILHQRVVTDGMHRHGNESVWDLPERVYIDADLLAAQPGRYNVSAYYCR